MSAQYIIKQSKHKGEVVETTYRIDADFIPSKTSDICQEFSLRKLVFRNTYFCFYTLTNISI